MSLQVWLPLNGDLRNQGVWNPPIQSCGSFTFTGTGKIGSTAAQGYIGWHLSEDILENTWSVAMWCKPISLGQYNNILFCKNISDSTDCHIYFSIISNTVLNIGVNGPSSSLSYSYSFTLSQWYHVAATYDGSRVTLYINGNEVNHTTVSTAKPSGRLNMQINGRSTNTGGTGSTGGATIQYNDFRLYDHCLSAAEVKEISQGLVLHYKLDDITNGIQDSSGYNYNGTITGTISIDSDSPRYQSSIYVNGSSYILTPAGSFAWNDLTQLTFSAWMKPTASMTGWRGSVGIAADANQTARGIAITDYGNEFRGTYTNGSSYATVATGKTLTQNEWHHCAGTVNNTEFKLYFDGVLVKTQTINWGTATLNANARFEVGVDLPGTDEKFTGNYSDVRCYCTALDADAIRQLYEVGAKIDNKGNTHTYEFIEHQDNILFPAELSRTKLEFTNGLNRYTQANCQVNLVEDGYHIYRPPNLTQSANGNTMWGGLKLVNQSTDTVAAYDANRDNWWHLQQNHTYIAAFHVRGKSSNATTWSWTNNMGWGGGGVQPSPTTIVNEGIPADFNGEKDCFYIFTITDAISKPCTTAYSAYTAGTTYLSYRHLTFGWGYTSTGTLGTDLYLTNFRLYDITSNMAQFTKQGQANFYDIVEQMDKAQIRKNSELLSSEFIEL